MPSLSYLRKRKFLTQKQMAEHLNVPIPVISAWERGIYEPRLKDLQRICATLEISISEIEFPDTPPLHGIAREYEDLKKGDSYFLSTARGRTAGQ
jgi:transcriptional regulator with XRE-family HTH domain